MPHARDKIARTKANNVHDVLPFLRFILIDAPVTVLPKTSQCCQQFTRQPV